MFGILELAKVELWLQSQLKGEQILNNNNSQTMDLHYPHFSLIKILYDDIGKKYINNKDFSSRKQEQFRGFRQSQWRMARVEVSPS